MKPKGAFIIYMAGGGGGGGSAKSIDESAPPLEIAPPPLNDTAGKICPLPPCLKKACLYVAVVLLQQL